MTSAQRHRLDPIFATISQKKLSLSEVASAVGVHPSTLWRWKTGKVVPDSSDITKLRSVVHGMRRWFVYEIICNETGSSYIGCTYDVQERVSQHCDSAKHHAGDGSTFHARLIEVGLGGFTVNVISVHQNRREALDVEAALIGARDPKLLYNRRSKSSGPK